MSEINAIICGDCLDVMRGMDAESVDCVLTDPPYGLSFMGKRWDYDVPSVELWAEVLRVLKDGGRLFSFAGSRTQHRMAVNIEDAGFCIEDCMMWLYGSGFPKHKSKLKPAYEPICVARKGKVSLLNIDAARIGVETVGARSSNADGITRRNSGFAMREFDGNPVTGRWPANIVLDEEAARALDEMSGHSQSPTAPREYNRSTTGTKYSGPYQQGQHEYVEGYGDSGGASRFFYCAKASASERNAGCDGLPAGRVEIMSQACQACQACGRKFPNSATECPCGGELATATVANPPRANGHPTVKPIALMRYLCKLAVPPGSLILDPFAGSGTTCIAAALEGMQYIGIEREAEYVDIARARVKHWTAAGVQQDIFAVMSQ